MERFQHALPWRHGLRGQPAQASDRRRREGDAEKMGDGAIRASRPKDSAALHLNFSGQRHVVEGSILKRGAKRVEQLASAVLARARVVVAVEEGTLLGDHKRGPRALGLELHGGQRQRDPGVI